MSSSDAALGRTGFGWRSIPGCLIRSPHQVESVDLLIPRGCRQRSHSFTPKRLQIQTLSAGLAGEPHGPVVITPDSPATVAGQTVVGGQVIPLVVRRSVRNTPFVCAVPHATLYIRSGQHLDDDNVAEALAKHVYDVDALPQSETDRYENRIKMLEQQNLQIQQQLKDVIGFVQDSRAVMQQAPKARAIAPRWVICETEAATCCME